MASADVIQLLHSLKLLLLSWVQAWRDLNNLRTPLTSVGQLRRRYLRGISEVWRGHLWKQKNNFMMPDKASKSLMLVELFITERWRSTKKPLADSKKKLKDIGMTLSLWRSPWMNRGAPRQRLKSCSIRLSWNWSHCVWKGRRKTWKSFESKIRPRA